ncbi:DNA polymerase alpha subunit B-like isoform X2 [Hylaeus volcanicus]|uniref:DNA polymerase alpha subunit B-like isoform X2 n=1 Tax=Hylaeus volcanicus TaxID=313075 RepID=UPI0023B80757|nr:DNA polymerase alpha subunit B-like isoform X2 [Hylaeus volcanicus]
MKVSFSDAVRFRHSWSTSQAKPVKRESCLVLERNDEEKEKLSPFLSSTPQDFSEALIRRTATVKQFMVSELQEDCNTTKVSSINELVEVDLDGWVFGRIVADNEGGLNEQSALLEITDLNKTLVSRPYELYLNRLPSYQVFPGQIVAVKINKLQDNKIYPERLIAGIQQIHVVDKNHLLSLQSHIQKTQETTRLMIAAGPFCFSKGFDTTVWDKFVDVICETLPDIVFLLGPFVDVKNDIIAAGDPVIQLNHPSLQSTTMLGYGDFYRIIFNRLLLTSSLQKSVTFVLVPSPLDVEHPYPLPQPPFDLQKWSFSKECLSHIQLGSNPSEVVLSNFLKVAVTSCDPLSPLLTSVLTKGWSGADRLHEIHSCLLKQLSFFPTLPLSIPVNPGRFHEKPCVWTPTSLPHILVYNCDKLPSGGKMVNGRLFLNCCKLASRRPSFLCVETHDCQKEVVGSLEDFISVETVYLK